jgi:hypothetical protein
MNEIPVFFRDDDVGPLGDPLRRVAELLLEESVPCSFQIVPTRLDDAAARYLRDLKRAHAGLVFLNQHGYRHQQEIGGRQRWSEFAGGRRYEEQLADIRAGRQLLADRLGGAFDAEVFTPPCHKYDANTLRALGELGFGVLSAGVRVDAGARLYYRLGTRLGRISLLGGRVSYHGRRTPCHGLTEVSVCIDVDEDTDLWGRRLAKGPEPLWRELEACLPLLPAIGVMLHHDRYEDASRLATLRTFVRRLKQDPRVQLDTLHGIAARCAPARSDAAAGLTCTR